MMAASDRADEMVAYGNSGFNVQEEASLLRRKARRIKTPKVLFC